jgi:hypothetical protein
VWGGFYLRRGKRHDIQSVNLNNHPAHFYSFLPDATDEAHSIPETQAPNIMVGFYNGFGHIWEPILRFNPEWASLFTNAAYYFAHAASAERHGEAPTTALEVRNLWIHVQRVVYLMYEAVF